MIYLDHAATSYPKPPCVRDAICWALDQCGNPGRSGHLLSLNAGNVLLNCREALCNFLGTADPMEYIFTLNCTDALNMAILGTLKEGDHAILSVWDHNSVIRPLYTLALEGKITLSLLRPPQGGVLTPALLESEIRPNTKLVVLNHVSNITGLIQPVKELTRVCHKAGIRVLVDGAQAVGHIPVNISDIGCDLYAFPGHKGLLGPQGTGALYIHKDCHIRPLRYGGTGSSSLSLTQPEDLPDYYESGTAATHGLAGLDAGVRYLMEHWQAASSDLESNYRLLRDGLSSMPGIRLPFDYSSNCSAIVSCEFTGMDASQVADQLYQKYGIACRSGLHCAPLAHRYLGTQDRGLVRFSLGLLSTRSEIVEALDDIDQYFSTIQGMSPIHLS